MLIIGLGTEAFIFFMSAFEKPHEEPDWSLVYPQLATGEGADKTPTQQLDDMLAKANIEASTIENVPDLTLSAIEKSTSSLFIRSFTLTLLFV